MTIREIIDGKLFPSGTYNIGFANSNHFDGCDETQFLCRTSADLEDLWADFADENNFARDSVEYIELEQNDIEILQEYLERSQDSLYRGGFGWVLAPEDGYGEEKSFLDWWDMITYMDEQNEEMRG